MASNPGTVIGVSAIGFGTLLLWSAYTKKQLFGAQGLFAEFFATGSFTDAGAAVGKTLQQVGGLVATPSSAPTAPTAPNGVTGEGATPPGGRVVDV